MEILHAQDIEENRKRLEKMQELKNHTFLERMAVEQQRIEKAQKEKDDQYRERKRLQGMLEREKSQILKDFEKKKKMLQDGSQIDMSQFDTLGGSSMNQSHLQIRNTHSDATQRSRSKLISSNAKVNQTLGASFSQKRLIRISTEQAVSKSVLLKSQATTSHRKPANVTPYTSMTPTTRIGTEY